MLKFGFLKSVKNIKKAAKIIALLFFTILLLISVLWAAFQFPAVQTYTAQKVAGYFSEKLETQLSIDKFSIDFWNKLYFTNFYVADRNGDTLAAIQRLEVGVGFLSWQEKKIQCDIVADRATLNLIKGKGDTGYNHEFFFDFFASGEEESQETWYVQVDDLIFKNSAFELHDFNEEPKIKEFDVNHLSVEISSLMIENIDYQKNHLSATINQLAVSEKNGLKILNMSSELKVDSATFELQKLRLQTKDTELDASLKFIASSFEAYEDFNNEVTIEAKISESIIDLEDLSYFTPPLKGLDEKIYLDGRVEGKVANIKGENIELHFDKSTYLIGDIALRGLPDFENTFIFFDVEDFKTSAEGLRRIPYPPFKDGNKLQVAPQLDHLGDIYFQGNFTGYLTDFVAYGNFQTDLGNISTDLSLTGTNESDYKYSGHIATPDFDLGQFSDIKHLGEVDFSLQVNGTGVSRGKITANAKGKINALHYKGYNYQNIILNGKFIQEKFTGSFGISDDNLVLDFEGKIDLNDKKPVSKFLLKVEKAKLAQLNLFNPKDSLTNLSFSADIDIQGNDIDDFTGKAHVDSLSYFDSKLAHVVPIIKLKAEYNKKGRLIEIKSDIVDGELIGNYKLKQFKKIYQMLLSQHIPNSNIEYGRISPQSFKLNAIFKNTLPVTEVLIPELMVDFGTTINSTFNTISKEASVKIKGSEINYENIELEGVDLSINSLQDSLVIAFDVINSKIAGIKNVRGLKFNSTLEEGKGLNQISWESIGEKVKRGELNVSQKMESIYAVNFSLENSFITVNDSLWSVPNKNQIFLDSSRLVFSNLSIENNDQSLKINGTASGVKSDTLKISLNEMDMEFISSLLPENSVSLKGIANGEAKLVGVYKDLSLTTSLQFDSLFINTIEVGSSYISSVWNSQKEALIVNGNLGDKESRLLVLKGAVYPLREENSLDLSMNFDQFPLELAQPYLEGYISNIKGTINGKVGISGIASAPILKGRLNLNEVQLKVDYLNTTYFINDEWIIEPDYIGFNLIEIKDSKGGKAIATGTIFHENYSNFNYDIGVDCVDFYSLNTEAKDNDLFYGTAYTSGTANISGYGDQLNLELKLKTEQGTDFKIPLDEGVDVSNSNFLIFTNSPDYNEVLVENLDLSWIQMSFDLEITPDAKMQIIFDEQVGDIIKAQGSGELKLEINTIGDFNIYGQYVVDRGDYLFTLKNVVNKRFDLASGSAIYWDGDPYQAVLDMQAIYNLRAPLFDLFPEDSTAGFRRRIPVELELQLTNYLMSPDIGFDIRLPTADENTKRRLESILYVNNNDVNRQEMNQQVFGLLVLNRFMPSASSATSPDTYSRGTPGINNGYEFLSNQLSNWFSRLSDQFDVGVKYRPADELNSDEVDLSLSTEILNDRLIFDGNVGYTGQSEQLNNQYSGFVGEFTVEYKLSRDGRYRVKGFNRSVTNSLLQLNSPYTQGVGLFYREEFDTAGELWRKYFKPKNKQ